VEFASYLVPGIHSRFEPWPEMPIGSRKHCVPTSSILEVDVCSCICCGDDLFGLQRLSPWIVTLINVFHERTRRGNGKWKKRMRMRINSIKQEQQQQQQKDKREIHPLSREGI
jgi:hypothetical protein